jgi:hypothetical protein
LKRIGVRACAVSPPGRFCSSCAPAYVDGRVVRRFLLLLLVLASAVASCLAFARVSSGGTHTAWAVKVNTACAHSQMKFDLLPKSDGTVAQLLVVLPRLTTISADLLADVRRVPTAASHRPAVSRLLHVWDDEITNDRMAYARLQVGDMAGFQAALGRT